MARSFLLAASVALFASHEAAAQQLPRTPVLRAPDSGNRAPGQNAFVGGGVNNQASGDRSGIVAGDGNVADGADSAIVSGTGNQTPGYEAFVGAGYLNAAGDRAGVVAGSRNSAGRFSFIGSGGFNSAGVGAVIGGGFGNFAGEGAVVGGGYANVGYAAYSVVGGGFYNYVSSARATVAGGEGNNATLGSFQAIAGGRANSATANESSVGGGFLNRASGQRATIPGGSHNAASGAYSFAAGRRARATHQGAFVWGDGIDDDKPSSAPVEFNVYASGGTRIFSNSSATSGVLLAPGGGSWTSVSDRAAKENFESVDPRGVLERLAAVPISTWNYKEQPDSIRHMGPMAQDFHATFGLGLGERSIDTIDPDGVALAAIQGLYELVEETQADNARLRSELDELRAVVARLEAR